MPSWFVYILRCSDGTLYTGMTNDLKKRLEKHNAGTGAKYTRSRKPVTLVWSVRTQTESAARKKEAKLKQLSRTEKLLLLQRQKAELVISNQRKRKR